MRTICQWGGVQRCLSSVCLSTCAPTHSLSPPVSWYSSVIEWKLLTVEMSSVRLPRLLIVFSSKAVVDYVTLHQLSFRLSIVLLIHFCSPELCVLVRAYEHLCVCVCVCVLLLCISLCSPEQEVTRHHVSNHTLSDLRTRPPLHGGSSAPCCPAHQDLPHPRLRGAAGGEDRRPFLRPQGHP